MLFLLNGDGTMTRLDSGRIFQGSNNFTELGVIYPFSGVTLSVAFTLPNGIDTDYTPMPSLEPYTLKGNNGETKVFENLYYTSARIPSSVTAMQGDVKVTVLATAAADVGGSTNPTQGTSFSATFTVEYAALPIYTVPDDPTEADFQKLVELLTAYQGTISGNVTELQERMTTAEGNITSLGERVTTAEGEIDDLQERMAAAEGNIEQAQGDISDLQSDKQDKTDNALKTSDKTVVGAINLIYDELTDTSGTGFASRLDTAEAEINVLGSRVEDVEEKTKDPLMTDFTVDVATSTATKFYNNGTQADVTLPTGDTAERINFLTSAVFTEEQWAEQSDGTYALTIPASQTGRTNNKYVANLEVTDGSMQVVSADKFLKNEDGSITLKDFSEPWSGRVITVAAGQHGSIIHFGTAVTGTGEQVSSDLELRAAAMVGDVYINTNTFEHYTCIAVSSTTSTWQYEGTSKGATGNPGKDGTDGTDGKAATVSVGQVTTLPAGSQATVTNSGDENAAVLNFGIPIGNTGQPGADGTDGQDGVGIQNIAADGQDENGGNIYRITLTNGQSYTFVAPKGATGNTGATGATGAPGKDFRIYKTYASVAAMNADASNVPDGEFVMIASTESDPDNAKLYVRTTDGEADFTFVSDLSGAQGIQGEAATIAIGQVLTGEPGTNASVENVGTANAAILNITIPRGNPGTDGTNGTDGAPGKDGVDGKAATIQIGEVVTGAAGTNASVENTGTENAAILKFTIPRGATGTPGANGQDGAPGADGKNGATFTPAVDTNGNLSWTNDGGLPNPETVNVRGAQGEAATVQVGTTTTLPAGSQATVNNSGTSEAAVLNFGIPTGQPGATPEIGENGNWFIDGADTGKPARGEQGDNGEAATIQVGTVTTGAAGTQASVTNSGTENAAVFDFTIPQGAQGEASMDAINLIPDENGAVNPGGRGSGTVGDNSTAIGSAAKASGARSTALGYNSNASGSYTTALGGYSIASGARSTALGYNSNASGSYSTALGYNANISSADLYTMQLGSSSSLSALRCKVNLTVTSDKRDKTDIEGITDALAFVERLNPVTFVSNDREYYISDEDKKGETFRTYGMCEYDHVSHAAGTKKGERRRCGLLAQEVVEAMQSVYGTDNYANIVNDNFHDLAEKPSDVENKYTLAYANLVPFLIGAIKELNAEIKVLEAEIAALEEQEETTHE